jgi:hypothetical protein
MLNKILVIRVWFGLMAFAADARFTRRGALKVKKER